MGKTSNKDWAVYIYLALTFTTLAVFWQVSNFDFVNYDDPDYVSQNEHVKAGLTRDGLIWAFTTGHASNWHPLTWLSHMLDCQLFGTNPGRHHLTSLLLHVVNALLLFSILRQMTGALWQSAFVAAAFALHPLHVESVAWISERKDVLSTLFWMLTMTAYLRYVRRLSVGWYLLALLIFAFGLMAKPMLVTLPFVLLLLDYWPLGRFQRQIFYRLVLEKVPFLVLSAASSVVTFVVQRSYGAVARSDLLPLNTRMANAFISYLAYIGKTIWPSNLAVFYPHQGDKLAMWEGIVAGLLLVGISIFVIKLARTRRYLLVGWFWYIGTLVPVIGLVQVGEQAMSDHYTYVPMTGIFIAVAWGAAELSGQWYYRKIALRVLAVITLIAMSLCARTQVGHWRNDFALFEHAVEVTKDNYKMYNTLGSAFLSQGNLDEAIRQYRKAMQVNPRYAESYNNLGYLFQSQGKLDEAISQYRQALQIRPNSVETHYNLANALQSLGRLDEAISHYNQVLQVKPDDTDTHHNIAVAFQTQGRLNEAISHYQQVLRIEPDDAETHNSLGYALQLQGDLNEAVSHYRQALRINPGYTKARHNLEIAIKLQSKLK